MASIKNLKKDINYVLSDIIEAVYIWEMASAGKPTKESDALIDEAIAVFDNLIKKVNQKDVENKKAHFKMVNEEFETSAKQLVEKINTL
ncbi:MAG: hypothetical protein BM557_04255 [Flavobacterium sp. MedPE-SWcel]|uniref:hypothetical protein n=1 Tax=uncultured Flavobacterium sp. TaxID=165435 RepID=UPI000915B892|nr:hypothetical protein [uncultured Flavobacterium sp.]OIQ21470.1 MAG: hypothetical protein BM557_04255 [Flavobacterium sp. MedPE-SWcel]